MLKNLAKSNKTLIFHRNREETQKYVAEHKTEPFEF